MPQSSANSKKRPADAWPKAIARRAGEIGQRLRRLPTAEEGTIAQLSLLAMMGCVLAIGLVGNVARITHEKVEVQNAADAAAHATALWHARSLNAITATNHLMGELTALCVLHEAIGGPELDLNEDHPSGELLRADNAISFTITAITASQNIPFDDKLVDRVKSNLKGDGTSSVGGALYDARMTLKKWVVEAFRIKGIAFAIEQIPIVKPIGIAIQAGASAVLIKCLIEWKMLEVMEKAARVVSEPKLLVQDEILPLLAEYQVRIAEDDPEAKSGEIEKLLERTIDSLDRANQVQSVTFRARLPVMKEPPPTAGDGSDPQSNSINTYLAPPPLNKLEQVFDKLKPILEVFNKIADLIGEDVVPIPNLSILDSKPKVFDSNPSWDALTALDANWNDEKHSQWTRATFPWVHSGRANLLGFFGRPEMLTFSRTPTFYGHWTNYLSVAKSYECRSGVRMRRDQQDPMAMHVLMRDSGEEKGGERWTNEEGSRDAEKMFTTMGFTQRPVDPLFSPSVFGTSKYQQFCFAQAICYNANLKDDRGGDTKQPLLGWDTLNWEPGQDIPDYGREPRTADGGLGDFINVFVGKDFAEPPRIKLNWQSKLVPVTKSRLSDALRSSRLEGDFREPMEKASRSLSKLNTH